MDNIDDEIFKNNLLNKLEFNHKRFLENLEKEKMASLDILMDSLNQLKKYEYKYADDKDKSIMLKDINKIIKVINESPDDDYDEGFKKWVLKECKIIIKLIKKK